MEWRPGQTEQGLTWRRHTSHIHVRQVTQGAVHICSLGDAGWGQTHHPESLPPADVPETASPTFHRRACLKNQGQLWPRGHETRILVCPQACAHVHSMSICPPQIKTTHTVHTWRVIYRNYCKQPMSKPRDYNQQVRPIQTHLLTHFKFPEEKVTPW